MGYCFTLLIGFVAFAAHAQLVGTYGGYESGIEDDMIFDQFGNLYGSAWSDSVVLRIKPDGTIEEFADGFISPNGLLWDGDDLIVVDNLGDMIYRVDTVTRTKDSLLAINSPSGISRDPNSDTIYVSCYATNRIIKMLPNGQYFEWLSGAPLNGPVGMAWDDTANLYIGNFDNRRVIKARPNGDMQVLGTVPGSLYLGFIEMVNHNLYATSLGANSIFQMDLQGNTEWVAGTTAGWLNGHVDSAQFDQPNGIVSHGPTGDTLYISDFGTQTVRILYRFDSTIVIEQPTGLPICELPNNWQLVMNRYQPMLRLVYPPDLQESFSYQIINMSGQVLARGVLPSESTHLDISIESLPATGYVLSVASPKQQRAFVFTKP